MKKAVLFGCVLLALLAPVTLWASPITALYVFGDSLSDQGNAYNTTFNGTTGFPPPPYAQRASNGPVAAEVLAAQLGVPLAASTAGGTNYAYVGALTGPLQIPGTNPPIVTDNFSAVAYGQTALFGTGILNQVDSFVLGGTAFNPDESLFLVWGGANDFYIDPSAGTVVSAVNNMATAIQLLLHGTGARQFLIPNLPNLALTPSGRNLTPQQQAGLLALTLGFNNGLSQALNALSLLPGIRLRSFDTFGLLTALAANPGAYGFTDAQNSCISGNLATGGSVCSDSSDYVFWDGVHPTSAAHTVLGEQFAQAVPEPATLTMVALGVGASLARSRKRR